MIDEETVLRMVADLAGRSAGDLALLLGLPGDVGDVLGVLASLEARGLVRGEQASSRRLARRWFATKDRTEEAQ